MTDAEPLVLDAPLLPLPTLCERIHDRVTKFLQEDATDARLKTAQEQTRISLRVIESALEQYRYAVSGTAQSTARC
jgi:FAD synthetase